MTNEELRRYLAARKELIDTALDGYLPPETVYPPVIFQAVRYSLFAGGKRLRPILCLAAAEVGGDAREIKHLLPAACALELIHTYSLIHDDLPALDNDDFRRGRYTCHKVFGEDIAILAGDALLTEAFHLLARIDLMPGVTAERLLAVIGEVAEGAGFFGMVGGQVADVQSQAAAADEETLHYIHSRKTAAMIRVALRMGCLLVGASDEVLAALTSYGEHMGLAFQIADDILNVTGDPAQLGKGTGTDAARGKLTYPALYGLALSRQKAEELLALSLADCAPLGTEAEPLRAIARYVVERNA